MTDIELLKVWHKGLRECREKISQKSEAGGASFKDTLALAKAADKPVDEDMVKHFTLLDAYDEKKRGMVWLDGPSRRREKRKALEREADAIATQRMRLRKNLCK